jgi:CYTH domain-containing protein/predicted ATPase
MTDAVEIVLTGGPGSGKTSALSVLSEKMADWGYRVLLAPEVATLLISGGVTDIGAIAADPERFRILEGHFLAFQRSLRLRYQALAESFMAQGERVVILYDRGESDIAAYLPPATWASLVAEAGLTSAEVRDSYRAVIHLVSAADGAEAFYSNANNAARRETATDARTLAAWVGHPHLRVIDNSTDFRAKMERTLAAVARVLGIPEPVEIERKFLLAAPPSPATLAALGARPIEIRQTYLRANVPGQSERVRQRGADGQAVFYHTVKVRRSATTRVETERMISEDEYRTLLTRADPARREIRKIRHCFVANGAYFELDEFRSPADLWILEIELASDDEAVVLPTELAVARELTDEPGWSNAELAKIGP